MVPRTQRHQDDGNESNELPLTEAYTMPPSPLSRPWIYLVAMLPLLAGAVAGAVLIRRRRRTVPR